ncbi:hypothetical protein ACQ4W6_25365, partial [Janthinobacterium sp. HLX7-2]
MPRDVHTEHTLIFDATLKRDDKRACAALEQHIRLTFDSIKWFASTILAGRRQLSWPVKRVVVNPSELSPCRWPAPAPTS